MEAISASLQNPNRIPKISHSSGLLSATTVEIPNPASVSVEERQRGENGLKITQKQLLTVFFSSIPRLSKDVVQEIESEVSCKLEQDKRFITKTIHQVAACDF
ncbi:BnaC06g06320D [Brassica napus]|uniref:BnaC06g06320D protein n=1 Tax=Brassica napus TaxID=3708 RepID=A0A078GLF4_BRANA|nr:BnaC06g06320D [Brassica napus]